MALINLNIKTFKKDLGGIADRLVDRAVGRIESKLENAVEDAVGKTLNKIGLSGQGVANFTSRFNDAFANGKADDFFQTPTSEQNRTTAKESIDNMKSAPGTASGAPAETAAEASAKAGQPVAGGPAFFQFPEKLGDYYMMMRFKEYRRPSPQSNAELVPFDTFAFPIPRDLKESFDINVGEKPQSMAGGIADLGTAAFRKLPGDEVQSQVKAIAYSYAVQATEKLSGEVGDVVGQFAGVVPNPHIQAIFEGIGLRKHSFTWTFAPRNPQESRALKQIIFKLKTNSLPAYSNLGTAALQYPPLVDIELRPKTDLIKFKTCIIGNLSVNYAPQGLPSFFAVEREPTMIQITLDLMETMIQTANDYGAVTGAREKNNRSDRATDLYNQLKTAVKENVPFAAEAIDTAEGAITTAITTVQSGRVE